MSVKLIMTWDIRHEREKDYFEFLSREWLHETQKLGLRHSGAWLTTWQQGDSPQIMAECLAADLDTLRGILGHRVWRELHTRLMKYVENYAQKIVRVDGYFQL